MAAALVNPPLLGPLSHNYASLVVCLDLLWCIWVRTYTREWGPRGQDRNLESPRKSTLDFREARQGKTRESRHVRRSLSSVRRSLSSVHVIGGFEIGPEN